MGTKIEIAPHLVERFWSNVNRAGGRRSCWLWTAGTFTRGYGQFRVGKKKWRTHRLVLALNGTDISRGIVIHSCDVTGCCNPAHLRVGTHAENAADRDRRGRGRFPGPANPARGEANGGGGKLTATQAAQIKRSRGHARLVAERFEVSISLVYQIRNGGVWAHV